MSSVDCQTDIFEVVLSRICHTFSIVTEAHFGLSQANCILALAHAIEFLKLSLIDTLRREGLVDCCRTCDRNAKMVQ